MDSTSPDMHRLLVTDGTTSWGLEGTANERDLLKDFLENVSVTESIQRAISLSVTGMRLREGCRVLDVGCGTGVAFPAFAQAVGRTGQIVGLDHGAGFLDDARKRAEEGGYSVLVELFRGDAHALPFPDDSFDAAHTERVFMHLDNPDLALSEMKRVVRPGGWISCVEPDLVGMRMDLVDPNGASAVLAGFCDSIRNPAMGLELVRRMTTAGLRDIEVETITEVERTLSPDDLGFFAKAANRALELGLLNRASAASTLEAMKSAADAGHFVSYSSMFIVSGQVGED